MADFNGNYLTCRTATETAAAPRTLKAIIEDKLSITLPGDLAASITIQNESDTAMKLTHLTTAATHYITVDTLTTRQLVVGNYRLPLSAVYANVGADNKAFCIEVVFE